MHQHWRWRWRYQSVVLQLASAQVYCCDRCGPVRLVHPCQMSIRLHPSSRPWCRRIRKMQWVRVIPPMLFLSLSLLVSFGSFDHPVLMILNTQIPIPTTPLPSSLPQSEHDPQPMILLCAYWTPRVPWLSAQACLLWCCAPVVRLRWIPMSNRFPFHIRHREVFFNRSISYGFSRILVFCPEWLQSCQKLVCV